MKKVLLADRNPDTRHILAAYLGHAGYQVEPCGTAEELLARLEIERPAAAIVELFDLGPGALGLVGDLARGRHGPPLPVLVFTSDPRRSLLLETDAAGARLLTKPASPRQVLRCLETLLGPRADEMPDRDAVGDALHPPT